MSGDLIEILFIAAFILFGLLGGRKKRPQQPKPRQRPPAARHPQASARRSPPQPDRLLRELEGLLTGRPADMQDVPDPDEARSLETLEVEESTAWEEGLERASEVRASDVWRAGRDRTAESAETLEEAGGASHVRFHALYDRPPQLPTATPARAVFRNATVRRAIVWSEILGPPVSLRDE